MEDVSRTAEIVARKISCEGAVFLPGADLRRLVSPIELDAFAAAWDTLGLDEYLPEGATYRRRRYGRLAAQPGTGGRYVLSSFQPAPFQQPAELIPLYKGIARIFEPIEDAILTCPVLTMLIHLDLAIIASSAGSQDRFIIGLHLIRIIAHPGLGQLPAPEGRHADGHSYVAMHLMKRQACEGGQSRVFLPDRSAPILETTLTESLDTLIVDDRRVEHAVTAVRALEAEGTRDVLLVDFDPD